MAASSVSVPASIWGLNADPDRPTSTVRIDTRITFPNGKCIECHGVLDAYALRSSRFDLSDAVCMALEEVTSRVKHIVHSLSDLRSYLCGH